VEGSGREEYCTIRSSIICDFRKYYQGDQTKQVGLGTLCDTNAEIRKTHIIIWSKTVNESDC
jgi:hypothetical protein